MHVVSGVPKRNGNNHVKEISDMAIDFQRAAKTLRMNHLPDQQVQMRVGVHSGRMILTNKIYYNVSKMME